MEQVKLTNRDLLNMYTALDTLGKRSMANVGADLKVGRLIKSIAPFADPLIAARNKIATDVMKDKKLEEMTIAEINKMNLEIMEKQKEIDDLSFTIELPLQFAIKEIDLPKEKTGSEGWKNADGLGNIVSSLGPLYIWDEEKK